MTEPPPAAGVRTDWRALPDRVRIAIEQRLGSSVVSAVTQPGGFSPGLAARVRTAAGQRVFIKAVGSNANPLAPTFHRREARIAALLPPDVPVPRLLWSFDEGDEGWIVLAFEDIEGRQPRQPWQSDELDRVLDALIRVSAALSPSPVPVSLAGEAGGSVVFNRGWWQRLRDEPPIGLDPWSRRHAHVLAEIEAGASAAVAGDTLLHLDIRADNLLLTPDRVLIVDWPHARIGAAWVDLVCFAPSVAMQGGPSPEELIQRHPAGRTAEAGALTAAVVALAGFFIWGSLQPPPPGLPTLRAFQASQGAIARAWAAHRTGFA
jgi:aminoglycoside phosphotransferase (APT) family kinase protein